MRRILRLCCLLFGLLGGAFAIAQIALQTTPPQHFVTDIPGLLTKETRENIDSSLNLYQKKTGHQVLVWIGTSTNGTPLEDWTVRAFEAWKVGRAGLDDGLVLFVFSEDHKVRIEVGYGLEGQIPDAKASQIIQEIITPNLKNNKYDEAITAGVNQILELTNNDRINRHPGQIGNRPISRGSRIALVILGIILLIVIIKHPNIAIWIIYSIISGGRGGGYGSGDSNRYNGGGGHSGGGGSSGSW